MSNSLSISYNLQQKKYTNEVVKSVQDGTKQDNNLNWTDRNSVLQISCIPGIDKYSLSLLTFWNVKNLQLKDAYKINTAESIVVTFVIRTVQWFPDITDQNLKTQLSVHYIK